MKSAVDTQLLYMIHSHQQHTAAIYISVCVMWHKGTSIYILNCQLQQVTQQNFKRNKQFIRIACFVLTWNYRKIPSMVADIQPISY